MLRLEAIFQNAYKNRRPGFFSSGSFLHSKSFRASHLVKADWFWKVAENNEVDGLMSAISDFRSAWTLQFSVTIKDHLVFKTMVPVRQNWTGIESLKLKEMISLLNCRQDCERRALSDLLSQLFKGLRPSRSETERTEPLKDLN